MTERAENTKRENIYLRKDGRWEARYIKERSPEGRAVYGSVYGRTREAAFQKRMEVVNLLNAQTKKWEKQSGWNINGKNTGIRFSQVAEAWFEEILPGIKESTVAKYKNMLYRYILPALGDRNIAAIDTEEIQHFCVQLLQSGGRSRKGLSEKTVADILSLIRGILRHAAAKGQSGVPDLSGVHIRQPKKQMRIFTVSEQKRLTDYLCSHREARNLGILLSLYMGLRIGEVCALGWEDISFSERTLQVRRTMQRVQRMRPEGKKTEIIITSPKSASSIREIPFPDALFLAVCSYRGDAAGFLLTGNTSRFVEPRSLENHFRRVLQEASVDYGNYHALRHTFATRCVEQGFDVKSLSEILGHSSIGITMNRYVHPSLESKRENMRKLTGMFAVR